MRPTRDKTNVFLVMKVVQREEPSRVLHFPICQKNKAGYTATSVASGWAGPIFEVTSSFGQEK